MSFVSFVSFVTPILLGPPERRFLTPVRVGTSGVANDTNERDNARMAITGLWRAAGRLSLGGANPPSFRLNSAGRLGTIEEHESHESDDCARITRPHRGFAAQKLLSNPVPNPRSPVRSIRMQHSQLEYRPDETVAQVDFTGDTVAELEPQHMIASVSHRDDP